VSETQIVVTTCRRAAEERDEERGRAVAAARPPRWSLRGPGDTITRETKFPDVAEKWFSELIDHSPSTLQLGSTQRRGTGPSLAGHRGRSAARADAS
jgi:hypothetical protein